ncbi:MAG: recombination protein RecR [Saprospiraceae bacterium]|nr:recombination protein RecR [Saprospiraceae bacterium]
MNQLSRVLEDAVDAFSSLPGIGRKTAMRLALHLAQGDREKPKAFAQTLLKLANDLRTCRNCHAFSDSDLCAICSNPGRDPSLLCIVESVRDVIAIEEIQSFKGHYFVLGGLISPLDGIGPEQLKFSALFDKLRSGTIRELILAIRPTIEGDTTAYYLHRNLPDPNVSVTMLARGVSWGSELEFADELTLSRSLSNRTPYPMTVNGRG